MTRILRTVVWVVFASLWAGCWTEVQRGLEEAEANELQTVLNERGLPSRKVLQGGKHPTWSIEVEEARAPEALRALAEVGLPRKKPPGFSEVFSRSSLVPTPSEERAHYLQAQAGELSRTLEELRGVVRARVHLVLARPARGGEAAVTPKASALLRVRAGEGARLQAQSAELQALIAGGVEGLSAEEVSLFIEELPALKPLPSASPRRVSATQAAWAVPGLSAGLVAVGVFGVLRRRRAGREPASEAPPPEG
jgi:type III secretion protein J